MSLHRNAALGLKGRRELCRRVVVGERRLSEAASAAEVGVLCAREWVARYRAEGELGLLDRSSAPHSIPRRTSERRVEAIAALRRLRFTGPEIAEVLGVALSTVSGILTRIGIGSSAGLASSPLRAMSVPGRASCSTSTSKSSDASRRALATGSRASRSTNDMARAEQTPRAFVAKRSGWEYVHIAIDDCARLAYAEVLQEENAPTVVGFLERAVQFFTRHGITVERLLTDNGSGYRSAVHAIACRVLGIRHLRTRRYRPQTNDKAERFIRTLLGGWAYGAIYRSSAERQAALSGWVDWYNTRRPHGSLSHKPPAARLAELNNLIGSYI